MRWAAWIPLPNAAQAVIQTHGQSVAIDEFVADARCRRPQKHDVLEFVAQVVQLGKGEHPGREGEFFAQSCCRPIDRFDLVLVTAEIETIPLNDVLRLWITDNCKGKVEVRCVAVSVGEGKSATNIACPRFRRRCRCLSRSEEHTSELQSRLHLV